MKIVINKSVLNEALKLAKNVIGSAGKQKTNCLANVLLEASDKQLRIVSSDGAVSCSYVITDDIDIEKPGKALVGASMLLNVVSKIKQEQIEICLEDSSLWVKAKNYLSQINVQDVHTYPDLTFATDGWTEVKINGQLLASSVRKVSHSALQQHERESRLHGVYFDAQSEPGNLRIIATDSFKLSLYRTPHEGIQFAFLINTRILELVSGFLRADDEVLFKTKGKEVAIQTPNFMLKCNSIDTVYPNVNSILDIEPQTTIVVSRSKLMDALERVISFSISDQAPSSSIKISGQTLELFYRKAEIGSSKETIELLQSKGAPVDFAINATFLLDHLRAFDNEEVTVEVEQDTKPLKFTDAREPQFLQILVPMRTN